MPPLVEAARLTRAFDSTTAVDGLDLTIDRGEVFGLLGPNGAERNAAKSREQSSSSSEVSTAAH